jgi:hypothetical protein
MQTNSLRRATRGLDQPNSAVAALQGGCGLPLGRPSAIKKKPHEMLLQPILAALQEESQNAHETRCSGLRY